MAVQGHRRVLRHGADAIRDDIAEAIRRLDTDTLRVLEAAGVITAETAEVPASAEPGMDVPQPGSSSDAGYLDGLQVAEDRAANARRYVETLKVNDPLHWLDLTGD